MNTKALLSFVLLSACAGTMASSIPEVKRDALCPGTTRTVGSYLRLVDPTGTTDYGWLTTQVAAALGNPSYGEVSFNSADGLYRIVSCDDALTKVTTVTASNAQTDPGSAIGLVAPYAPNGGYPQLGAGSANWAFLAPTTYTPNSALPEQGYPPDPDSWFESGVWKKNCKTTGGTTKCFLDPVWKNPDGSTINLSLAAVPGQYLVATGDYGAFVAEHGYVGSFVPVRIQIN